jgi:hypothetical protein
MIIEFQGFYNNSFTLYTVALCLPVNLQKLATFILDSSQTIIFCLIFNVILCFSGLFICPFVDTKVNHSVISSYGERLLITALKKLL